MKFRALFASVFLSAVCVTSGATQEVPRRGCPSCQFGVSFVGGISQYDLSGTGSTSIVGIHLDRRIRAWLLGDASVRFLKPVQQFGYRAWYGIPELQIHAQLPNGILRPYIGAGGGWFIGEQRRGTASGSLGLRYVGQATPLGARAELRVRGIGRSFGGSTAEWTAGATYRF